MDNIQKDGPYSWVYLTATCIVSFTFIGIADSMGIFVAVFIEHLNESNAKGGTHMQSLFCDVTDIIDCLSFLILSLRWYGN